MAEQFPARVISRPTPKAYVAQSNSPLLIEELDAPVHVSRLRQTYNGGALTKYAMPAPPKAEW